MALSFKNNLKAVFSSWKYIAILSAIATSFWIIFASLDGLLFFSPFLVFWLPSETTINFIFSTIISVFIGLVVSMNIYHLFRNYHNLPNKIGNSSNGCSICKINLRNHNKNQKNKNNNSLFSLYISPLLAMLSTGCISCSSSFGLLTLTSMSSIIGISAATAFASFISEYQTPIRLLTLALLGWSFVSINKSIANNIGTYKTT